MHILLCLFFLDKWSLLLLIRNFVRFRKSDKSLAFVYLILGLFVFEFELFEIWICLNR